MDDMRSGIQASKETVRAWWGQQACGTQFAESDKFTPAYFAEIEEARYRLEPYIHSFAQFTRYRGKKVLEVGIGAGTDFVQWVRVGALAYGIDLTAEAVAHTRRRLELEGLQAMDLRQADAEHLDYPSDLFDLVYSWGVIHYTSDPFKALSEIVRVARPGGGSEGNDLPPLLGSGLHDLVAMLCAAWPALAICFLCHS
jgi:SAM-dependent methyltransferase